MHKGLLAALLIFCATALRAATLEISDAEALSAGKRLWKNECAGTVAGLTSWNAGEDFASFGIGHYIWYPAGHRGPFEESFPDLLRFLIASGAAVPGWLREAGACPWQSRAQFQADIKSARMTDLRGMLARTVALQARFSANRLQTALPQMIQSVPGSMQTRIERNFARVAAAPNGTYALIDYVNFKGEGTLPAERYQGEGWGLAQVLAGMSDDGPPTRAFSDSAARTLTRRVQNSPPARGEARWLPGWKSRVRTYAASA